LYSRLPDDALFRVFFFSTGLAAVVLDLVLNRRRFFLVSFTSFLDCVEAVDLEPAVVTVLYCLCEKTGVTLAELILLIPEADTFSASWRKP
jgi:hypothetical protein